MRKITTTAALVLAGALAFSVQAWAHFAMIIPSKDVVGKNDKREISLMLQFTHPFEAARRWKWPSRRGSAWSLETP